jgi:hypothetical protein
VADNRVTGLGEFSPIGLLVTLCKFLKIKAVAHILGYFLLLKSVVFILPKMGWATFWAIFPNSSIHTV